MRYIIETKDEDFEITLPDEARVELRGGFDKDPSAITVSVPMEKKQERDYQEWSIIAYYENVENFRRLDDTERTNGVVA